MVVVPSGYEVGELAKKYFFASLCARPNLARREIERGATPLTDRAITQVLYWMTPLRPC